MTTAMARARLTDGIEVIFDQDSRSSFRSGRSRSGSRSSGSGSSAGVRPHHRSSRREAHRRRHHRSSSSSSSGSSSSRADRPRSRSHPRCHRPADRCRCDDHYSRYTRRHGGGGRRRRSPPRHYRSRSRSYSPSTRRSASQKRDQRRSSSRRYSAVRTTSSPSQSPPRSSRSRSRSSGRSVSLSVDAKRELLSIAAANAVKLLGVEKLELPESVRPILEDSRDSRLSTPEPEPEPEERRSDESDEDDASPRMSPKRKIISFSINNSVAKPTVAPNCPKVTSRMDIVGSRKPYGHWVRVRAPGKISMSHTLTTSR